MIDYLRLVKQYVVYVGYHLKEYAKFSAKYIQVSTKYMIIIAYKKGYANSMWTL